MPVIQVMLKVAPQIAMGLASGRLERVGGIIRESSSKRVVAWLREGGQIANNSQVAVDLFGTLLDANTGVVNAALAAGAHRVQMQQLRVIQGISSVAAIASVAGLVVQIASTRYLARKIDKLGESILSQFEHDRQILLEAALEYVEKIIPQLKKEQRAAAVETVSLDLIKARKGLLVKSKNVLSAESLTVENVERASNLLLQAMQIDTAHVRIFLDSNRMDVAKSLLEGFLHEYKKLTQDFVQALLESKRARYFYKDVGAQDLFRYVLIEEWLRDSQDIMTELVLANRDKFWDGSVIGAGKLKLPGGPALIEHLEALTYAENLIENYNRLIGYQAEIEAIERLGITQAEWDRQQDAALKRAQENLADFTSLKNHDDYVVLVDEEWLEAQSEESAA